MPSVHDTILVCGLLAIAAGLRFVFRPLDRRDDPVDETDVRLSRLKHDRMARGQCIYCAAPLPEGATSRTLASSVCWRCAPANSV